MNKLKRISLVTLGIIALFTTATFAKTGTVNAPSGLVLREEKSKTSNPITTVTDNAKVEILEESGEWYKVKYNSNEGYLFAEFVDVEEEKEPEKTEESKKEETQTEPKEEPETNSENNTNQEEKQYPKKQKIKADLKEYTIPSVTANTILNIKKDEEVTINYELNNWANITYGKNTGWIRRYFINSEKVSVQISNSEIEKKDNTEAEKNKTDETATTTIKNKKGYVDVSSSANIRKEASTSSEIINTLLKNTEVIIIAEEGDFYKIQYKDIIGYISKSLVSDKPVAEATSRGSTGERKPVSQENTVTEKKGTQSTQTTTIEASSSSPKGNDVASFAKKYIGYNYVYGGSSPSTGFDCSGFASYVYNSFGYTIGRTCTEQISKGTAVSKSNLLPGDLVFFNNGSGGSIGHVGIYVGGGQIVHAENSRTGVRTDTINSGFYNKYYYSARRIIK